MKITAIIIDDETINQLLIKSLIKKNALNVEIIGEARSVEEGIALVSSKKADLIFLDIEIIGGTGFDVIKKIQNPMPEIIFITAYEKYAIEAIKKNALDYILKPIDTNEFILGINKAIDKVQNRLDNYDLLAKTLPKKDTDTDNIIYFEASGSYTYIIKLSGRILSSKNIGEIEKTLDASVFFRCHHSFIVNTSKVSRFIKGRSGALIMKNGDSVPVSQRKMKSLLDLL